MQVENKHETGVLVRLESACRELAEAMSIHEVKEIRDKAAAIKDFMRQRRYGQRAQNDAAELKLRAERKLGELLAESLNHNGIAGRPGPGRGKRNRLHDKTGFLPPDVSKTQSHRFQRVAGVPEADFERYITETREKNGELTTASVLRLETDLRRKRNLAEISENDKTCTVSDFSKLVAAGRKFGCVYADPPWQYKNQRTRAATDNHYPTMSIEDICALPVAKLGANQSHLHLWTTNAFLEDSITVLRTWGFEYKGIFLWLKPTMGLGNYWRVSNEILLLGVRGGMPFLDRSQKNWLMANRTRHSSKPNEVRKIIEKVSPGPRLELFGRKIVDGWTVWGNQISREIFDAAEMQV
jgi:N6-adenosine-specific RNA methylase IME4